MTEDRVPPKRSDLRGLDTVDSSPGTAGGPPQTPYPATGPGPPPGQNETTHVENGQGAAEIPAPALAAAGIRILDPDFGSRRLSRTHLHSVSHCAVYNLKMKKQCGLLLLFHSVIE